MKVFPTIRLFTFELACRLFMSIEEPVQIEKLAALFDVFIKGVISIPVNVPGTRFYKAKRATNAIRKELQVIMKQRKLDLEQKTATTAQDLLSYLLSHPDENGQFMSDSVILNNILLLLFAGHDTSSCVLTMLMNNLALHPQVYDKVLTGLFSINISYNFSSFVVILCSFKFEYQSKRKSHPQKMKENVCNGMI